MPTPASIARPSPSFTHLRAAVASFALLAAAAAAQAAVSVYPAYPAQIARNTDFRVSVSQGGDTAQRVEVYNPVRSTTGTALAGDNWRRFCEFQASDLSLPGREVVVRIKVRADWSPGFSYRVVQAGSGGLSHSEAVDPSDGLHTITVRLAALRKFVVRINNDDNKTLAVFPDAPETDPPKPGDPGVVYIGAPVTPEFYSPSGRETDPANVVTLRSGQTLYVKPGAVLNARVTVGAGGTVNNVTIKGRGMVRDGVWSKRSPDYMIRLRGGANGVVVRDLKLVDSTSYAMYVLNGNGNVDARNLKILSNQINSDGFGITHDSYNVSLRDSFIHNADNVFLVGSTISGAHDITFEDNLVGSTASTIFLQGNVGANVRFSRNTVFRNSANPGDDRIGLISAHFGSIDAAWRDIVVENLDATGSLKVNRLFYTNGTGGAFKQLTLRHVDLPRPTPYPGGESPSRPTDDNAIVVDDLVSGRYGVPSAGNLHLVLDDVRYDGRAVTGPGRSEADVLDRGTPRSSFAFPQNVSLLANASFEAGSLAGWSGAWGRGAAVSLMTAPGVARSGIGAARVAWSQAATAGLTQDVREQLRVQGPGAYRAVAWVKTAAGTLPVTLRLGIDGSYPLPDGHLVATTTWQKVTIEGRLDRLPSDWAVLAIAASGGNVTYYVDDVSLTRSPAP